MDKNLYEGNFKTLLNDAKEDWSHEMTNFFLKEKSTP